MIRDEGDRRMSVDMKKNVFPHHRYKAQNPFLILLDSFTCLCESNQKNDGGRKIHREDKNA